ncbi:MAG: glycogen/starch synthase, partial [Acutalibacteraceae bacterium]|nr:glycogen/starch synthase [Acutalibacteraceae bacterium]
MKVLYVASEALPFMASGGLGDVAGSLPPALAANGDEVAVILPLYG